MTYANKSESIYLRLEGGELGKSMDFEGRAWLQKDGLGKGGATREVRANTFAALYRAGLIELQSNQFPTAIYCLKTKEKKGGKCPPGADQGH